MVEAGRSAGAREAKKTTSSTAMKKKKKQLITTKPEKGKDKSSKEKESSKKQSSHCTEPESPSYMIALKSIFSCRNSHGHSHAHHHAPKCKKLGCSASTSKLKDNPRAMQRPGQDATAPPAEPCKRRASVSACNSSSERCVKKPLSEVNAMTSAASKHGGSLSSTGGSFRGMQLRRLSGCYECHMVVDPISGVSRDGSMRATIRSCPDCGQIFVRPESLELHQSTRHAVCELGPEDTGRNIIEIIFQSSWLRFVCKMDRILKVRNTPKTLARFEEYRDSVKAKASNHRLAKKHPRCTADGNELLRFHCATLACSLGLHGATHLCDAAASGCSACGVIRDGFRFNTAAAGIRTMATSGRAHDAVEGAGERRAMLVCRVIAGRVKRAQETAAEEEYDSVAGSAGVYSNLDELEVFNPRAILPCFVVVYKA